LSQSGERPER
jgi:hypothetical protein